jgi:hypothetical protein
MPSLIPPCHLEKVIDMRKFFVFATLVFAHFAFSTLIFDILLLPLQFLVMYHFCPMWGKTKMKMMNFCFAFVPFVVVLVLVLPLNGRE